MPTVSVVIATRDRPTCLARLLSCVKAQSFTDFECLVVDDGSSRETFAHYDAIWRDLDTRFHLLALEQEEQNARGPSATRNKGIRAARGSYVAFCDDDDIWTRRDHLSFAVDALVHHEADLYFANMQTSRSGEVLGQDFYGTIRRFLTRHRLALDLYEVAPRERALAMKHMFLHCDSLVVSTQLLQDAGLFWEKLFMAEDRDLGLRLLDCANRVLYRDVVSADYDRTVQNGICKSYTEDEIRQFVILAMLHAETMIKCPQLRRVARGYRAWMLVELAQGALQRGRLAPARELARQSLLLRPTLAAAKLLFTSQRVPFALQRKLEA